MAAAGIGNPAGYMPVTDGGNPRVISGKVRNEQISGGVLVYASGASDTVSSGANSFVNSDILFTRDASGLEFNGVCMQTTSVSGLIAVATKGIVILACNKDTIIAGQPVVCDGFNSVQLGSTTGHIVGKALTGATSGGYCLVDLNA